MGLVIKIFKSPFSRRLPVVEQTPYTGEFITEMGLTYQERKLTRNPEKLSPIHFLIQQTIF